MPQRIAKLVATLFFTGYVPLASGTLASLLAIPLYLLVKDNILIHISLTAFLLILGFWSAGAAEKTFPVRDSHKIVIDEFSSMLLVYVFIPFSTGFLVAGFLLFRFFDIFKIPAVKKLERLPSGYGIMLDDIAAAVLTNLILQIWRFFPI